MMVRLCNFLLSLGLLTLSGAFAVDGLVGNVAFVRRTSTTSRSLSASSSPAISSQRHTRSFENDGVGGLLTPHRLSTASSTSLYESVPNGGASFTSYDKMDWAALTKYSVGLVVQLSLMFGLFTGIDKIVSSFQWKVPFLVHFLFLYGFNLKASVFSILPNKRSSEEKLEQSNWEYNKRKKPSWTLPGIAFVLG